MDDALGTQQVLCPLRRWIIDAKRSAGGKENWTIIGADGEELARRRDEDEGEGASSDLCNVRGGNLRDKHVVLLPPLKDVELVNAKRMPTQGMAKRKLAARARESKEDGGGWLRRGSR